MSSEIVSPSTLNPAAPCEVEIEPLIPHGNLALMDMSVFLDVALMDGKDSVPRKIFFPTFLV
ncbi:unnamed protein product [Pylaiella littoralis]